MRRQVRSAIGSGLRRAADERALRRAGRRRRQADLRRGRSARSHDDRARRARCRSATPRPRTSSRSRCAIGSAASRRTRSSRTSRSASTRRTRSIARPTARASACTSSRTRRRRYVVNVAYGIATEVVCTFDRGAKAPLRLVGVFVHPGRRRDAQAGTDAGDARPGSDATEPRRVAERQFGPYRLVRQIAVGGMAEIHLAKTKGIAGLREVRRAQDDPPELRGGRAVHPDARRRGEDRGAAHARQHRADVRPRPRRRDLLHHDGVRRRRGSLQDPAPRLRAGHRDAARRLRVHRARRSRRRSTTRTASAITPASRSASCTATCRRRTC